MKNSEGAARPHGSRLLIVLLPAFLMGAGLSAVAWAPSAGALVRPSYLSPGSVPKSASALGAVPAAQDLTISIVVPPQNQSELSALLKAQSDPNSPEYHHWLTSEQFSTEFGPDPQDSGLGHLVAALPRAHSLGLGRRPTSQRAGLELREHLRHELRALQPS